MKIPESFRGSVPVGRTARFLLGLTFAFLGGSVRLAISHHAPLWVLVSMAVTSLLGLLLLNVPSRVLVAEDGVYLRWLFFQRFLRFATLESVYHEPGTSTGRRRRPGYLTFRATDGRETRLSARAEDAAKIHSAIDAELTAYRAGARKSFDARLLDRGPSDGRAWLTRLRELSSAVDTFRTGAPTREELAAIVDDAHAEERQRAAAAVILAKSGVEEDRVRVRETAAQTASPKLRVALEAALDEEKEDAIAAALDDVERGDRA